MAVVDVILTTVVVAVFAWGVWSVVAVPAALNYDEAVYASHTRHLVEGTPDTTWFKHRAPALPAIGTLAYRMGDSDQVIGLERGFRLVGLSFGVVALLAVRWLARTTAETGTHFPPDRFVLRAAVGLVAMGVLALNPSVIDSAATYMTDLPAAALLALAAGVLWREFEVRQGPSWGLLTAAPLIVLAFYMRFGSALFIALLALVAAVLWWRQVIARPAPVIATGVLMLALLLPHMVDAMAEFGTPWGRVLFTSQSVADSRAHPLVGLLGYVELLPFDLAGPAAGPAMIIAAVGGVATLLSASVTRRWTPRVRAWAFLVVPAIAHILLIGWRAQANVRFLYPAFVFLAAAAALLVHAAITRLNAPDIAPSGTPLNEGVPAAATLVVVAGLVAALHIWTATTVVDERVAFGERGELVREMGLEIGKRSEAECFVVATHAAQILWYSGCGAGRFTSVSPEDLTEPELRVSGERFQDGTRWIALFEIDHRRPDDEELQRFLDTTAGEPVVALEDDSRAGMEWVEAYRVLQASP